MDKLCNGLRLLITFFSGYFAFMLFVVYALDNPFQGPIRIKPKAYEVIYNYDVNTHGHLISPEANGNPYPYTN